MSVQADAGGDRAEGASGGGRREPVTLVLATRNAHKAEEVGRMLEGRVRVLPLPPEAPTPQETGLTFAENALIKARSAVAATGRAAFADDSGIEADALDGAPGVFSARFAGPDADDAANLALLVRRVPPGDRLRFRCAVALVTTDRRERVVEGVCCGRMAQEPRGSGGFGYDPVFIPDDLDGLRTLAEVDPQEKDRISHRGRAMRGLLALLEDLDPDELGPDDPGRLAPDGPRPG